MLSPRGWWFFGVVFALLLIAIVISVGPVVLMLLTLLAWFVVAWARFQWRTRRTPECFEVERDIFAGGSPVNVLWARQPATVRVRLNWTGDGELLFVLAVDKTPPLADWRNGTPWVRGRLSKDEPLVIEYPINCPAAGQLRFDGLKIVLADLHGFFHRTLFLRRRVDVRVLPPLVAAPRTIASRKRHNLIPLVGTHRLFRPGGGSELLDLRDYVPSDPPKLIAWKPSARRDRLITKELESEVPVRCTLFLDASSATRVGPVGRNALARLVEIAAAVLYANTSARDLTGLVVLDELGVGRRIKPARGRRAFYEMLHLLSDIADEPPAIEQRDMTRLLPVAIGLAQDVYPEWLRRDVNSAPWWSPRFWRRDNRRRKRIAAILANVYGLGAGGLAMLSYDDDALQRTTIRWLNDHRVAVPLTMYDDEGRYLFRGDEKIKTLARALTASVTTARDNELFVLLVDLLDAQADREPLARAVKMARARHHHVQIVCPWPPGVPLPDAKSAKEPVSVFLAPNLQELLSRVWTTKFHNAFAAMRREFGGVGARVIAAPSEQTVPQILERMNRLRRSS